MKKLILLLGLVITYQKSFSEEIIYLKWIKSGDGLAQGFLNDVKQWFNNSVFVETGTYGGETTYRAALVFDKVYSIELSEKIYQSAYQRLSTNKKINLYCGDSGDILTDILPVIDSNILFWLDAHYCGEGTGRGRTASPILQELEAIKNSGIKDAIILVDDLRGFYYDNWPTLDQVIYLIYDINSAYKIVSYADTIMAYPDTINIGVSPCLEYCTISRFFDSGLFGNDIDVVLDAEELLVSTIGSELSVFEKYLSYIKDSDDPYGKLWKGLLLHHMGQYEQASLEFRKLQGESSTRGQINHWRVDWYLARSAYMAGNNQLAHEAIQQVILKNPSFSLAQELCSVLNK